MTTTTPNLNWIANYIWGIADDVLPRRLLPRRPGHPRDFEFRNQIPRLSKADALGSLIEKLTSPEVNLSPDPVIDTDGTIRHPGLDNHGMGTIFEELIRRFNEENNEEAGEHFTPRDAVALMAKLVFLPVADQIESGTYLLYDGACGTGGMLTVAEMGNAEAEA